MSKSSYWIVFALLLVVSLVLVTVTTPAPLRTQGFIIVAIIFGVALLIPLLFPSFSIYPVVF